MTEMKIMEWRSLAYLIFIFSQSAGWDFLVERIQFNRVDRLNWSFSGLEIKVYNALDMQNSTSMSPITLRMLRQHY